MIKAGKRRAVEHEEDDRDPKRRQHDAQITHLVSVFLPPEWDPCHLRLTVSSPRITGGPQTLMLQLTSPFLVHVGFITRISGDRFKLAFSSEDLEEFLRAWNVHHKDLPGLANIVVRRDLIDGSYRGGHSNLAKSSPTLDAPNSANLSHLVPIRRIDAMQFLKGTSRYDPSRDVTRMVFPDTLASEYEIRKHDGFNALLNNGITMRIQPSCFFRGGAYGNERRDQYVPFQITVDETQFSKLNYHDSSSLFPYQLYSAKYYASEGQRRSFIRSKGLDPDKTIIVSPYSIRNSKFLDDLVLVFPDSLLLPFRESSDKNQNPLQIDAKEDQANSEDFADWREWPKKIIDLPPDLEQRRPRP
ncbi:hypothetical protein GG344DRAFT_70716 [Lentinula edodes]|nr:hypothetical protein GG344DRAFT_70716 [Lentinula edodes]